MNRIGYGLKVLWAYWYFALFVIFFFIFYPLFALFLSSPRGYGAATQLRRIWAIIVMTLTGIPISITYELKERHPHGVIYCPNHFSYLDIPTAVMCTNGTIRFMAKMELGNIPIFNIFFRTIDISVNRGNRAESYKAIKKAEASLDAGYNLVVFPEGTIGPHPPTLLPFKNGPFRLAIEKQAPIVPVTFINNWQHLYVEKKIYGKPGVLRTVVHEAIPTKGLTLDDVDMLRDKVYAVIYNELQKHWGNDKAETHNFAEHDSRRQTGGSISHPRSA